MQKFCITPVLDHGRQYYMVNWPGERERWSRRAPKRRQKKFTTLERAEEFLAEVKREWVRRGRVSLAYDPAAHYDFMRAMKLLSGVAGSSLEKAALVYLMCVSAKEVRGGGYAAPTDRKVELSPRIHLACVAEAQRRGASVSAAADGMLGSWLEKEANRVIREKASQEAAELEEQVRRNENTRRILAQIAEEGRLRELMGQQRWSYEQGQESVRMKRRVYQREWYKRKRERKAGNGSNDLQ